MPNSRDAILKSIRNCTVPLAPLPEAHLPNAIEYPDRIDQYRLALETVGGTLIIASDVAEAWQQLQELPSVRESAKICSLVPGLGQSTFDLTAVTDPHELEDVDLAILPGEYAIAENAAVWFSARDLPHRVLPFITQHLVLVVPYERVLNNLHEVYEHLEFGRAEFGALISGPSKTADIEQSLVIGAHGPRSHAVVLLKAGPSS